VQHGDGGVALGARRQREPGADGEALAADADGRLRRASRLRTHFDRSPPPEIMTMASSPAANQISISRGSPVTRPVVVK